MYGSEAIATQVTGNGIIVNSIILFLISTVIFIILIKITAWAVTTTVLKTIDHHKNKNILQESKNKFN